jgi:hypothetical protein
MTSILNTRTDSNLEVDFRPYDPTTDLPQIRPFSMTLPDDQLITPTPTDDDLYHTLSYIPEETQTDDDWDDTDGTPDPVTSTPIPPVPPVLPPNVPGLSNPTNPPFLPPGNQTFTKFKQKLFNFFQNF